MDVLDRVVQQNERQVFAGTRHRIMKKEVQFLEPVHLVFVAAIDFVHDLFDLLELRLLNPHGGVACDLRVDDHLEFENAPDRDEIDLPPRHHEPGQQVEPRMQVEIENLDAPALANLDKSGLLQPL